MNHHGKVSLVHIPWTSKEWVDLFRDRRLKQCQRWSNWQSGQPGVGLGTSKTQEKWPGRPLWEDTREVPMDSWLNSTLGTNQRRVINKVLKEGFRTDSRICLRRFSVRNERSGNIVYRRSIRNKVGGGLTEWHTKSKRFEGLLSGRSTSFTGETSGAYL